MLFIKYLLFCYINVFYLNIILHLTKSFVGIQRNGNMIRSEGYLCGSILTTPAFITRHPASLGHSGSTLGLSKALSLMMETSKRVEITFMLKRRTTPCAVKSLRSIFEVEI